MTSHKLNIALAALPFLCIRAIVRQVNRVSVKIKELCQQWNIKCIARYTARYNVAAARDPNGTLRRHRGMWRVRKCRE